MPKGRKGKKATNHKRKFGIVGRSMQNILLGSGSRLAVNQFIPKVGGSFQGPLEEAVVGIAVPGQKSYLDVAIKNAVAVGIRKFLLPRVGMGFGSANTNRAMGGLTPSTEAIDQ